MVEFDLTRTQRLRLGAGAVGSALAGLGVAVLVAVLGHPMVQELVLDGEGVVPWIGAWLVSLCYVLAVALMLAYVVLGWGWYWPSFAIGAGYAALMVIGLKARADVHGYSSVIAAVAVYLTSMPYQLAAVSRQLLVKSRTQILSV